MTDHGNLHGAVEFLREAKAADFKPIIGMEAYVAPGRRTERSGGGYSGNEHNFHLTLLARNGEGVRNLMRLSSMAFLEGFYYKPRIDKEILERHSEGLICLSGCVSSEFSDHVLHGKPAEAEKLCAWYQKVFGEENFFVEIQCNGIQIQKDHEQAATDLARRMGLPLVATSDAHYLLQGRRRGPRHPPLHQHRPDLRRPEPDAVRERPVPRPEPRGDVRGPARPRGGPGHLGPDRRDGRGELQEPQPRQAPVPLVQAARREDARGLPPRALRAGAARPLRRQPPAGRRSTGWSTSWASSTGWGSPRTS